MQVCDITHSNTCHCLFSPSSSSSSSSSFASCLFLTFVTWVQSQPNFASLVQFFFHCPLSRLAGQARGREGDTQASCYMCALIFNLFPQKFKCHDQCNCDLCEEGGKNLSRLGHTVARSWAQREFGVKEEQSLWHWVTHQSIYFCGARAPLKPCSGPKCEKQNLRQLLSSLLVPSSHFFLPLSLTCAISGYCNVSSHSPLNPACLLRTLSSFSLPSSSSSPCH